MKKIILFLIMSACLFGANQNPASKTYVSSVEGEVTVFLPSEGRLKDISRKEVYEAEGLIFDTSKKSNQTMVMSNGSGVYIDEETRLEIKKFVQEPFKPDRNDIEVEPSISQTKGYIPRGKVAICTSKIVAGSTMMYETDIGRIKLYNNKVFIDAQNDKTTVISIEGELKVELGSFKFEYIKTGQKATITKDGIKVEKAEKKEFDEASDKIAFACQAKKEVYFEITNSAGSDKPEIKVTPVAQIKLPTEFTISRARLD